MSRREIAFLMIGLGLGLLVACTVAIALLAHTFLLGVRSPLATVLVFAVPAAMVIAGEVMLFRHKRRA